MHIDEKDFKHNCDASWTEINAYCPNLDEYWKDNRNAYNSN